MLSKIIEDFLADPERSTNMLLQMQIHTDDDPSVRKFRVSDAGRCRLYRYWKRQGKPQPKKDIDLLKIMEIGNLIHAWLAYILQIQGLLYHAETSLEDTHRSGHLDAIVDVNGYATLYDFKTIGSKQAWYMLHNGMKAQKEHQYQVLTYLDLCTDITSVIENNISVTPRAARIAYILRESYNGKNGDSIPPLSVVADIRADLDLLPAVRQDWQILIDAWTDGVAPKANPESWECRFCPYKDACEFLLI